MSNQIEWKDLTPKTTSLSWLWAALASILIGITIGLAVSRINL